MDICHWNQIICYNKPKYTLNPRNEDTSIITTFLSGPNASGLEDPLYTLQYVLLQYVQCVLLVNYTCNFIQTTGRCDHSRYMWACGWGQTICGKCFLRLFPLFPPFPPFPQFQLFPPFLLALRIGTYRCRRSHT